MRRLTRTSERGTTLIEVLVAAIISAVVAAGTLSAFVTAARISTGRNDSPQTAEAYAWGQRIMEQFRNRIAADDWPGTLTSPPAGVWQDAALPGGPFPTESIRNMGVAERRYCVRPFDCDGDTVVGDCLRMEVRVCWDGTACPVIGSGAGTCS